MITEQKFIEHLETCFNRAEAKQSKLTQEVHDIMGMTGEKTRHLYNNLLSINGIKYLEIGTWAGSSSCSAMYGNCADIVLVDNFVGFGGPREICLANIAKYKGDNSVYFLDEDCFKVDLSKIKTKFNMFLFDGDHSEESQFKALDYYLPVLEDMFVLIVDDWNWLPVREGTYRGIKQNNLNILWQKEIRLTQDNEYTYSQEEASATYWNGISVFLIKK